MERKRAEFSYCNFVKPKVFVVVFAALIAIVLSCFIAPVLGAEVSGPPMWHTVRMRVTAYCPCAKCCGEWSDGFTATGHKIDQGDRFAAADRRYAFGTEMVIAGYNNGEVIKVLDRGGAIKGDRLDVFFNTHEEALVWGVQYIDVKIRG